MANVDPVSEFLAREQDALADLNDEDDDLDELVPPPPAAAQEAPVQNGLAAPAAAAGVLSNGGDSGVDLSLLDRDNTPASPPMQNGGSTTAAYGQSMSRGASSARLPEEEPEKIRKWREAQQKMIVEKDKAEEKKKEELRHQAKKELEEWHAQRKVRLEQRKKDNRERENNYRDEVGGGASSPSKTPPKTGAAAQSQHASPQNWERIAKMMEAGAKSVARGTKDTSRMKSLVHTYKGGSPTPNGAESVGAQ